MFKRLLGLVLILAVTLPSNSFAVPPPNAIAMPALTPMAANTPGNAVSQACDQFGVCLVTSGTGATDLGKAEDAASTSGFTGVAALGVRNDNLNTQTTTDGDYSPITTGRYGQVAASIVHDAIFGTALQATKPEDAAAASGDALVGVAGQINTGFTTNAANGDYATIALGSAGNVLSTLAFDASVSGATSAIAREDTIPGSGDAGIPIFMSTNSALAADAATNNDYILFQGDELGRTITTLAPAGESWSSCSSAIAAITDTTLKAAVASNRIYVTAWSCIPNDTGNNRIILRDGVGGTVLDYGNTTSNAAGGGSFQRTYPVPLRLTSNTALNLTTNAVSSTFCCASGYISVN